MVQAPGRTVLHAPHPLQSLQVICSGMCPWTVFTLAACSPAPLLGLLGLPSPNLCQQNWCIWQQLSTSKLLNCFLGDFVSKKPNEATENCPQPTTVCRNTGYMSLCPSSKSGHPARFAFSLWFFFLLLFVLFSHPFSVSNFVLFLCTWGSEKILPQQVSLFKVRCHTYCCVFKAHYMQKLWDYFY